MAANAESSVSIGALRAIYNGQTIQDPVLQCLQIKALNNNKQDVERFRCVFSDVNNFIQSMLGTELNRLVKEEIMKKGSFVRIKNYQTNDVKGKTIMVVLDCEVLSHLGERDKLGVPEQLEPKDGASAPTTGAPAAGAPSAQNAAHVPGPAVKDEEDQKIQPNGIASKDFYGNKPAPAPQQKSLPSRPSMNGVQAGSIYPIEAVSPYAHKWTIKARCTFKSDIKTWHKPNSEGKLFSVNLLDESGEIKATGFNEAVDQLYEVFQEGTVYYVSAPCRVQFAKKQFTNLNNDYELTFERDTMIEKAEGQEQENVPRMKYNFTNIADLQNVQKDSTIDAIGILQDAGECSEIIGKASGNPYNKRELTLVDDTGFSVRLTIWGKTAQTFNETPESVLAFKGLKVSDFGGRSLSLLSSGNMSTNPDIDEAHKLKGWYDAQGRSENYTSHASLMQNPTAGTGGKYQAKTIAEIKEENIGMSEEAQYFNLKATVVFIKDNTGFAYPACSNPGPPQCNKKVTEIDPGQWQCEKCDRAWPKPQWRYVLAVNVQDHTGQAWLSCFDDTGRTVIGATADEMMELKENDERRFGDRLHEANCRTWMFRCRARMDNFQDQTRVRYQVVNVSPVDWAREAKGLVEQIKLYDAAPPQDDGMFVN